MIASRDNPTFKQLRLLATDSAEQRSRRQTVIDGPHLLQAALDAGVAPATVLLAESAAGRTELADLVRRAGVPPVVLRDSLFRDLAGVATPAGIAAVIAVPPAPTLDPARDVVVLCGLQDAGNVGGILRTAAAAGIVQVVLDAHCAGAWTPKVLRAAQGAHFRLRLIEQAEPRTVLAGWKGSIVATVARDGVAPWQLDLQAPVAWLFGSEGGGLAPDLVAMSTARLGIPMAAGTESLNVAAAAAICLFDYVRRNRVR